jgi:hypothetical protein
MESRNRAREAAGARRVAKASVKERKVVAQSTGDDETVTLDD